MNKDDNKQPWEQPIYQTEYEDNDSRSQQRNKKKGNTLFITTLVILLTLIAGVLAYIFYAKTTDRGIEPDDDPIVVQSSLPKEKSAETTEAPKDETADSSKPEAEKPKEEPQEEKPEEQPTEQAAPPAATENVHEVQPGETLYRIAMNNGTTVEQLMQLNGLSDNTLSVGQKIKIK